MTQKFFLLLTRYTSNVSGRITLGVVAAVICATLIAITGVVFLAQIVMEEKRTATRHLVESAHGILVHHASLVEQGKLTREQAQAAALSAIKSLRYEKSEYFWVNDMYPRMVMHPIKPELDGKELTNNKDPSGKFLFVEFVRVVQKSQAGFVDYLWPKPGQSEPVQKISYVKGFEPWGWVIGSGIYVDDVQSLVWSRAGIQGLMLVFMLGCLLAGGWRLRRSIAEPIDDCVKIARSIADGKLETSIEPTGPLETRRLMASLKDMQADIKVRIEADQRVTQALDACSVPIRIVDNKGLILYLNRAMEKKIAQLEPAIRLKNPDFDKDKLIGQSIGIFYPDPEEAVARLSALKGERRAVLEIGGRQFDIVTNPIVAGNSERIGTVGEWVDREDEIRAQQGLSDLLEAASQGDFSKRVDTSGLSGFHRIAADGVNNLLDQVDASLRELGEVLGAMARGDLSRTMRGQYHGQFRQLQVDMNSSLGRLASTVSEIRQAAQSVNSAAHEIAEGNTDLSMRTEKQASSLEQTSANMDELIATIRLTTENTSLADRVAGEASRVASDGGRTVGQVVQTMAEIGESSRRVEEIISVINGIAFQTNILALNAAVEAARAGESGRGFAVVASEVRALAQRSAEAAREIRGLIEHSSERVEAGGRLVQTAGTQMNSIVESVKRVTEVIAAIATVAKQQNSGIERMSHEVRNMDGMTQQNAALVEQAAAAAESLEEQATILTDAISTFELGGDTVSVVRKRAIA